MIQYKTETRPPPTAEKAAQSPDQLLEERRAYFYRLVDQVFDRKDDPEGRYIPRTELFGLTLHDLLGAYAAMRTSRVVSPSRRSCRSAFFNSRKSASHRAKVPKQTYGVRMSTTIF